MNNEKFKHLINLTIKNIFRRRLRSILTIISVMIGIAAIIALVLVSDGLFNAIEGQFTSMGTNSIFIFGQNMQGPSTGNSRLADDIQLNMRDVKNIDRIPEVKLVSGISFRITKFEFKAEEAYPMVVIAKEDIADDTFNAFNMNIAEGTSIQGKKGHNIVIGPYIAEKMFNSKIKIGNKVKLEGIDFKVIGILEAMGNSDDDSQMYITREIAKEIYDIGDNLEQIIIKTKEDANVLSVKEKIEDVLEKDHEEDSFMVITANQILELIKGILNTLKIILIAIAAISIVVGSIGIMNSIYTSVIERTKEIGILKAIGAKANDIYILFISESVILSLVGGVLGLILGALIAKGVEWYAISQSYDILTIIISWQAVFLAIGLALVIGVISGLLPSKKATRMKVVDALKDLN